MTLLHLMKLAHNADFDLFRYICSNPDHVLRETHTTFRTATFYAATVYNVYQTFNTAVNSHRDISYLDSLYLDTSHSRVLSLLSSLTMIMEGSTNWRCLSRPSLTE